MTNDEATTEEKPVIFPRLTEDMTKEEITNHLREMHGFNHLYGHHLTKSIKITKERLLEFHNEQHEVIENPRSIFNKHSGHVAADGSTYLGTYTLVDDPSQGGRGRLHAYAPAIKHTHASVISEATDEAIAMASKARNNEPVSDKPLNAAQRKVLKELVDNDFNALRSETQQFAADALESRNVEIDTEWVDAKEKVPGYVDEYRALRTAQEKELADLKEKHEKARQKIRDHAGKDGIAIKEGYQGDVQGEVTGLNEAKKQARAQNQAMLDRAMMTIERQRLTAQRRVLISGVDSESAKILDEIPDAQTLMVESQRQQAELTAKAAGATS